MPFNEIRQPRFSFIGQKFFGRHGKDLVDFFECELFGFADKGEYHEPCDEIEGCVEAEGAGLGHYCCHSGECEGQDSGCERGVRMLAFVVIGGTYV